MLGVLYLAAYLERAGIPVSVWDIDHEPNWRKRILDEARTSLCVGISAMTGHQITNGLQITNIIKKKFPNLPIIWGAGHVSTSPEQALAEKNIDIVVRGEGEETLLELVKALADNKDLDNILGISFKKNGKIIHNPDRPFLDMNDLPNPAWHFINIDNYYFSGLSSKNVALQSSRGCPHRCEFCMSSKLNKRCWRAMSAPKTADMVEHLNKEYGVNGIVFWDDNFFVDFNRVREFCKLLIGRNLNIKWEADCRIDYLCRMDDDLLQLLKSSGLSAIFSGAESGLQETLNTIKKDITVEQILEGARITAKYGFKLWLAFVIGFPHETKEDAMETIRIMKRAREINPNANPAIKNFFPFPGSALYEEAKKANFKIPDSLAGWGDYRSDDIKTPWTTHEFAPYFPMCLRLALDYDTRFSGLFKNSVVKFFAGMIHNIEKFRWDHEFYHFPIELVLVKKIAKKLGFY